MCAAVLAMVVRTMTLIRVVPALLLLLFISAPVATADPIPDTRQAHVRILDRHLRTLFEEGLRDSPTLRALVSRLEASDVVVYLQPDPFGSPAFAGRTTLLSVVGDTRYMVIRLTPLPSDVQQLGMVGHELQHAVEVAERRDIVDEDSMYREYARLGYMSAMTGSGVAFETREATEVGTRVSEEMRSAASASDGHVSTGSD